MTTKQPGQPSKFWLAFTVSSFEMPIAFAFALYGLASLVFSDFLTPPSVEQAYELWLVIIWHALMGFGGLFTFIGRLFELERMEMSGLAAFGGSCLYYMAAAYFVNGKAAFGLTVLLGAILWACVTRMYVLKKSLKAQDIARGVVEAIQRNNHANGADQ